jgi:hypothetical protein
MTRFSLLLTITTAVVLIGLGGFFWVDSGRKQFRAGYVQCQADGAVLATEAGRQLHEILTTPIEYSDVDAGLRVNGWMRNEADR